MSMTACFLRLLTTMGATPIRFAPAEDLARTFAIPVGVTIGARKRLPFT
jgi:hypothetical protein